MAITGFRALVLAAAILLLTHEPIGAFAIVSLPVATRHAKRAPFPESCIAHAPRWDARLRAVALDETTTAGIPQAKQDLKRALEGSRGSTNAEGVVAAVEALSKLNPTAEPGKAWPLLNGDWKAIGEDFPGTTRTTDGMECTLGRLGFNMYRPVDLPLLLGSTTNLVGPGPSPTARGGDVIKMSGNPSDYILTNRFSTRETTTGPPLRGKSVLYGSCVSDPAHPQRLQVWFSSGLLEPGDGQDLDAWCDVINAADKGGGGFKKWALGPFSGLGGKAAALGMKLLLGIRPPADELGERGELSFEMTRSPKGYLDVLFLDEDMRITRGNRGSLVVATRL